LAKWKKPGKGGVKKVIQKGNCGGGNHGRGSFLFQVDRRKKEE